MNKFKITNLAIIAVIGIVVFLSECQKAKLNKETVSAEDNATAENLFTDIFKIIDDMAKNEPGIGKTGSSANGSCAIVTLTPPLPDSTFPKTVLIDFGSSNCTGTDGRERRGKIIAVFSGRYYVAGTVITISTDDFYVDDNKIDGIKIITNNGRNSAGNLSFTIKVDDGMIITSSGDTILWETTRTAEWVAGESTTPPPITYICDDVYEITGYASGVNRNGREFTMNITQALVKKICCKWIVSGTVEITPKDLNKRTIDFGDGDCDNKATVMIKKRTFNIILR